MNDSEAGKALSHYQTAFKKAVGIRRWSMISEKVVSYAMPPLATAMLYGASLVLNIWEHIPPQGRTIGSVAFLAALVASPFLGRKAGSVLVGKKDAIAGIDKDIDDGHPARRFNDTLKNDPNNPYWVAGKISTWEKYGAQISDQKFKTGFRSYYNEEHSRRRIAHGLIAGVFAASLTINGVDSLRQGWDVATDWTVPLSALEYTATITPPFNVESLSPVLPSEIQTALAESRIISAHEGSVLRIVAQNRSADVYINGEVNAPIQAINLSSRDRGSPFIYEIELLPDIRSIHIENDMLPFQINPDQAPEVSILGAQTGRGNQPSLHLEYIISDDTGAQQAIGSFILPSESGEARRPMLDVNQLPEIETLPYDR